MKRTSSVFVILIALVMFACGGDDKGSSSSSAKVLIGAKLIAGTGSKSSKSIANHQLDGLGVDQLSIVAYQWSPGYVNDSDYGFDYMGTLGTDWAYYGICAMVRNHKELHSGEILDIQELNNGYVDVLTDKFKATYSQFSIDFLDVHMSDPGILVDKNYFGMDANEIKRLIELDPDNENAAEYLDYTWYQVDTYTTALADKAQAFDVIFARRDWFPDPIVMQVDNGMVMGSPYTIISSDPELTSDQSTKLLSLMNNSSPGKSFRQVFIIPFDSIKVAVTEGAEGMVNPEARIVFNFTWNDMITDETINLISANPIVIDASSKLVFKVTNNIPMGLSMSIVESEVIPSK